MKSLGLRARIIIMAAVFMLLTNLALGALLMKQSRDSMKALIDDRMLDVANSAAAMVDGNVLDKLKAEDKTTPEYQSVLKTLSTFRDNIGLAYIYYVRKAGDKKFTFGIDPDVKDPAEFGSPVAYTKALGRAGRGYPSVDDRPYKDKWGRFYSAYSPVFTSDGKVAAIIAVDFKASWYENQLNQNAKTIIIACILFMLIGIGLVLFLTRQYGRLIGEINTNLNDLADDMASLTEDTAVRAENDQKGDRDESRADSIIHMGERISELRDDLRNHINHINTQEKSMITAMSSDYRTVYYVDLDKDDAVCYRSDPYDTDLHHYLEGEHFPYREVLTWYADNCVADLYREEFRQFIDPDNIRKALLDQQLIAYQYLTRRIGGEYYEMIRMAGVRRPEDRDDNTIHAISLGFTNIDEQMRDSMAKNEALAEALAMAEEASVAKTAFLSNMSHEIRTPMNAIIGLDTLALNDDTISDQTREYLEKIGDSAHHLLGLINDILDMSRIESGRITLNKEEFSLKDMLEQINTMVMSQCSDKGLAYECNILSKVNDYYIGDDTKLKEVLINILSNAIKFTEPGGSVSLSVEQTAEFEDQSTLEFHVKDTGIGMDKEYIPKIFDAFSQEDSSRKNKFGSTGLGMAITKNIVEMMNGSIEVESEKGVGTEFTVIITLKSSDRIDDDKDVVDGEAALSEAVSGEDPDQGAKCAELAGRRILLAEDIELNADILMDILEMEDIESDHAENGRIALEMFVGSEAGTYDAILMDIRMPEMDGLEAAEAIRALDRPDAKKIPIIALTANAFNEDVQRSLQVGMNAHLTKPVEPEHLYQTLGELICEVEN